MTTNGSSPALHLMARPGIQRIPSPRIEMFMLRGFLDHAQCNALIERIEAKHRPSTLANHNGESDFRTSETCDFDAADTVVAHLDARLAEISGINASFGEPLQGQRYEAGQEFKAHTDYFEPTASDYAQHCAVSGQRTWTFMIYLNDVEAGGATRFKEIGKTIQPEAGKLLAWNNRLPDGGLNGATSHHAMKVRKGLKYVVTRWYRERPWG